jgi:hypothetical protein
VCLSSGAWGMMLFGCREPASTATRRAGPVVGGQAAAVTASPKRRD